MTKVYLKIIKLKQIIKSRYLIFLNRNKKFVKDRRDICKVCPYSSKNSEKTKKVLKIINLNKDYCTACGCGIEYKISVPESVCGLEEKGLEPKWKEYGN